MTEHATMPAPAQAQQEIGPPLQLMKRIPLASPIIDAEMREAALSALENEKLVMGESVHKFEEEFARYCGTKYAVSTGSGTAALSITLQALGISHGSEVVTTPFSFIATANAVLHAGAEPVFADVEDSGINLSPGKARRRSVQRPVRLSPSTCTVMRPQWTSFSR